MCESSGSGPSDNRGRTSSSTSSPRMSTEDLYDGRMARPTSYTSVSSTATSTSSSSASSTHSSPTSSPPSSSQTSRSYSTSSSRDPVGKNLVKTKNGAKQKEVLSKEAVPKEVLPRECPEKEEEEEEGKKKEDLKENKEEEVEGIDGKRDSKMSVDVGEEGINPFAPVLETQGPLRPEDVGEGCGGGGVRGDGRERRVSNNSHPDSPIPKASNPNSCSSSSNSYSLSSPSPRSLSFKDDRESGDFSSRERSSSKGEITLDEHDGGPPVQSWREDKDDHTKKGEDIGVKDIKQNGEGGERGGKSIEGGGGGGGGGGGVGKLGGRPGSVQVSQKLSSTQLLLQEKLSKGPPLRTANGSKAEDDVEEETAVKRRSSSKSSDSGEHKAMYRLSMKLAPSLFDTPDFPAANQHQGVEKSGFLNKLSGRSFPYIPQWKRRYCVLSRGKLYYYEREDSKPGDKSTGVLNLEYFDQVAEAGPKECKKATNVFLLTSQDKSFFDPGRHLFSADTLTEMNDWVRKLQSALDSIRRNKRHLTNDHPAKAATGGNKKKDDREEKENLSNSSKDRKKRKKEEDLKKKRKTQGVSSETQTRPGSQDFTDGANSAFIPQKEGGGGVGGGHPGGMVNLAGLGMRIDGGRSSSVVVDEEPRTSQQLENITKNRVKGPSGRRAPQKRRTNIAAKHRASSLSALEVEALNDNRSEPRSPTPCSPSATSTSTTTTSSSTTTTTSTSSSSITATQEQSSTTDTTTTTTSNPTATQVSTTTNTTTASITSTSESITLSPPVTPRSHSSSSHQSPTIDVEYDHVDVESDMFFSDLRRKVRIIVEHTLDEDEAKRKSETLDKEPKKRSTLKVDSASPSVSERRSRSRSKSRMSSKLSRFRDALSSYKKERYVTKDVIDPSHPDVKTEDNWPSSCVVL